MAVLRDVALKTRVGLGLVGRKLTRKHGELLADGTGLGLIAYAVGWVDGLRPSLGVGLLGTFVLWLSWRGSGS